MLTKAGLYLVQLGFVLIVFFIKLVYLLIYEDKKDKFPHLIWLTLTRRKAEVQIGLISANFNEYCINMFEVDLCMDQTVVRQNVCINTQVGTVMRLLARCSDTVGNVFYFGQSWALFLSSSYCFGAFSQPEYSSSSIAGSNKTLNIGGFD